MIDAEVARDRGDRQTAVPELRCPRREALVRRRRAGFTKSNLHHEPRRGAKLFRLVSTTSLNQYEPRTYASSAPADGR